MKTKKQPKKYTAKEIAETVVFGIFLITFIVSPMVALHRVNTLQGEVDYLKWKTSEQVDGVWEAIYELRSSVRDTQDELRCGEKDYSCIQELTNYNALQDVRLDAIETDLSNKK